MKTLPATRPLSSIIRHQPCAVRRSTHDRLNSSTYQRLRGSFFLLVALALLLPACSRRTQAPPAPIPEVSTYTVTEQSVTLTTELPGHTSPFRIAEVRPQVNGLIQKRLFTEGSDVKAGDLLYQIDPAQFQAALENAQAALARAEANLPAAKLRADRYQQALATRAVSKQDFDDAAAALKLAQADIQYYTAMLQSARINLDYALIKSPIPGRIGPSAVTDGAIVTAYQPLALATIQQLDPIYVDVPQSATDWLRLRQEFQNGQLREEKTFDQVRLVLPDGTPYAHQGSLQFRDVSVDPTTGSVILRMIFPNPDKVLLPGMFVRAIVKQGANDKAILVPQQTVSRDGKGNPLAFLVGPDGKVQQRLIVLDRVINDQWLVAPGLTSGDRVIAEGMQKVRPGSVVREVPFVTDREARKSPGQSPYSPASETGTESSRRAAKAT